MSTLTLKHLLINTLSDKRQSINQLTRRQTSLVKRFFFSNFASILRTLPPSDIKFICETAKCLIQVSSTFTHV